MKLSTTNIDIDHPNGQANFTRVGIGNLTLWFSYKTIVAFRVAGQHPVVRRNDWGPTTGKHLNLIDGGDTASRVHSETFDRLLSELEVI